MGFVRERNVSYVIFQKPLTKFTGRRIVGINYALMRPSAPQGRIVQPPSGKNGSSKSRTVPISHPVTDAKRERLPSEKTTDPKPTQRKFRAVITFTASKEVTVEVEAESGAEAKKKALWLCETPTFPAEAIVRRLKRLSPVKA